MTQEIINVGEAPNDGNGDPLRTAFVKTNNNFSTLFAISGITGIANGTSNVSIPLANSSIIMSVSNVANVIVVTSSGLQVAGNANISGTTAVGNITASGTIVANGTIQSLGGVTAVTVTASGNLVGGNLNIVNNIRTSDMLVTGNITNAQLNVTGNIAAANILATGNVIANGTSITATGFSATNGNIVGTGTLLSVTGFSANSGLVSVAGNTNITGNVAAPYFIGNGSQLTGVTAAPANIFNIVNANGTSVIATSPNDTLSFVVSNNVIMSGNNTSRTVFFSVDTNPAFRTVTANAGFVGDLKGTVVGDDSSILVDAVNNKLYGAEIIANGNVSGTNMVASGNITGSYIIGNGSQLTGVTSYSNANVVAYGEVGWAGNILPSANITYNLGSSTQRWNDLWLANSTIHLGPATISANAAGNIIMGNINVTGITSSANISAPYILGNIVGNVSGTLVVSGPNTGVVFNDSGAANATSGLTFNKSTNALASTGNITASGNISGTYILGNGALLTGVITSVANINSGTSNVTVVSSGGNVTVGIGGTSNVAVFSTSGTDVTGNLSVSGNTVLTGNITSTLNVTGNINAGNLNSIAALTGTSLNISTGSATVGNILNGGANGAGNIGSATTYFNTVFAKATSAQYADIAERYQADAHYAPGTVVVFGGSKEVTKSNSDEDVRVAGVVSTDPAFRMNDGLQGEHVVMIALLGRVPCAVRGTVKKGDLMVSTFDGYARSEANPKIGSVIGKAIESFDGDKGIIEVVVGRL